MASSLDFFQFVNPDAGYWECHIEIPEDSGTAYEAMFGVATKKDRKFYNAQQEQEEGKYTISRMAQAARPVKG